MSINLAWPLCWYCFSNCCIGISLGEKLNTHIQAMAVVSTVMKASAAAERAVLGFIDGFAERAVQHRRLEQVDVGFALAAEFRETVGVALFVELDVGGGERVHRDRGRDSCPA